MPVRRRKGSPYFQIRFKLAGREVRRTTRTTERAAAEELEEQLRRRYWRQVKLGEKHYTWNDAVERCKTEDEHQRSWERTERALAQLEGLLDGSPLREITRDNLLKIRKALQRRTHNGKPWAASTVNRVLAVVSSILQRCADEWEMIETAPKVPLLKLDKTEPRWATREQIHALLSFLPPHSRDMAILACATGMRRTEVTHLKRAYVDLKRATAYVPAAIAKNGEARVVPLNSDALAVLRAWMEAEKHHAEYVFSFRRRAPIKQVSTRVWRRARSAACLAGFRFHDLRHTWASWQAQEGTPLQFIQELGGWKSLQMVQRYAHLSPGHLAQYAERSALGVRTESGTLSEPKKKTRASC
jgi:integrase